MLVLSRKEGERIVIGQDIVITVVEMRGDRVRLGINAPVTTPVHREEIRRRIDLEQAQERLAPPDDCRPNDSPFFVECA
jgi:carbon storage regulator